MKVSMHIDLVTFHRAAILHIHTHLQHLDAIPRDAVPHPHSIILPRAGHIEAVLGEGHGLDPACVAGEDVETLAVTWIPQAHSFVPRSRGLQI